MQEPIDGDLAARVFGLLQVVDTGTHAQRVGEHSRQRLEIALLGFFQNFRKVYVGEQVMHCSKVRAAATRDPNLLQISSRCKPFCLMCAQPVCPCCQDMIEECAWICIPWSCPRHVHKLPQEVDHCARRPSEAMSGFRSLVSSDPVPAQSLVCALLSKRLAAPNWPLRMVKCHAAKAPPLTFTNWPCAQSQVYTRLSERLGVTDHVTVLNIMLQKIAVNLKAFASCEDVISHTLALFQASFSIQTLFAGLAELWLKGNVQVASARQPVMCYTRGLHCTTVCIPLGA